MWDTVEKKDEMRASSRVGAGEGQQ